MAHDRRSQAHRRAVRSDGVPLLPDGGRGGAPHPGAAGGPERWGRRPRPVQPAVHDARADDDLPGGDAAGSGVLQLPDPADDRRARRRVPQAERALLLDLPLRRDPPDQQLLPRRRPGHRLVRLRPSQREPLLRQRDELLRDRAADPRRVVARRRAQLRRHDHQHAGAGHDHDAVAGLRLDDARGGIPPHTRAAGADGRVDPAALRPQLRHELLPSQRRRGSDPLAASLLDIRPPGGLHPDPAGDGNRLGGTPDLLAQAALRLPGDGLRRYRDRVPGDGPCGVITCSRPVWEPCRASSSPRAR